MAGNEFKVEGYLLPKSSLKITGLLNDSGLGLLKEILQVKEVVSSSPSSPEQGIISASNRTELYTNFGNQGWTSPRQVTLPIRE